MIPMAGGSSLAIGMPGFNLTHRSDEKRIIDLPKNRFLFEPSSDESDN
jgi:hypothetical protein